MKIVFLVINYMPHQLVSIKSIIQMQGAEIHAFSYIDAHTIPKGIKDLYTYELKDFSKIDLLNKIAEINPQMIVVAGWFVKEYVWVAKQIRKKLHIPVVSCSDTQWRSTWKQKVNCLISQWHLKKAFTHIWVAGVYQFEYARKLGFRKDQIIYNSLSCDTELFKQVQLKSKEYLYPKKFLFIGRFIPVKGLALLVEAWKQVSDKKGWSLKLIGDGLLKEQFLNIEGIEIKDSMSQIELIDCMEKSGCFVLPSKYEPWAVVIHEAAVAGLPIIATNICGASPHLIINGWNGYQVQPKVESIKKALEKIMNLDAKELYLFSENSRKLSESITPELGAAQLMSVLNNRLE